MASSANAGMAAAAARARESTDSSPASAFALGPEGFAFAFAGLAPILPGLDLDFAWADFSDLAGLTSLAGLVGLAVLAGLMVLEEAARDGPFEVFPGLDEASFACLRLFAADAVFCAALACFFFIAFPLAPGRSGKPEGESYPKTNNPPRARGVGVSRLPGPIPP